MNRLKELRLQAGWTQAEFGKIFNASQNTVSDDGLDDELVNLLVDLFPSEVQLVLDFVAGLKAARAKNASHQG